MEKKHDAMVDTSAFCRIKRRNVLLAAIGTMFVLSQLQDMSWVLFPSQSAPFSSGLSLRASATTSDEENSHFEEQREEQRQLLRQIYTTFINEQVHRNNWELGCNDLQFLAPYLRAINDRLHWGGTRVRRTILDVGANNGDDAQAILGNFKAIRGMCSPFGNHIQLFSIEPSPKVFCEMSEMLAAMPHLNDTQNEEIHLLNIALSDQTGNLQFSDPGHEGGKLVATETAPLSEMTQAEFDKASKCSLQAGEHKNMSIDINRQSVVPTYTLDLLLQSLISLGKHNVATDRIFVLKIDTEGHDYQVLKGAANLLEQKRIDFVVFETTLNSLLKSTVEFMSSKNYECYFIAPNKLVPLHVEKWWYPHLDNYTTDYWGNAMCGIAGSRDMRMLWHMYHSDDPQLLSVYDILYDRNRNQTNVSLQYDILYDRNHNRTAVSLQ